MSSGNEPCLVLFDLTGTGTRMGTGMGMGTGMFNDGGIVSGLSLSLSLYILPRVQVYVAPPWCRNSILIHPGPAECTTRS